MAAREEQGEPVVGARDRAVGRRGVDGAGAASAPLARAPATDQVERRCAAPPTCSQAAGLSGGRRAARPRAPRRPRTARPPRRGRSRANRRASRATSRPDSSRRVRARRPSVGWRGVTRTGSSPRPSAGSRRRRRAARGCGQVLTSAIAASMSGTSITLKPPTISLASLNGPSTTTGPSSPCLTRGRGLDTEQLGAGVGDLVAVLLEPLVDLLVDRLADLRVDATRRGRGGR